MYERERDSMKRKVCLGGRERERERERERIEKFDMREASGRLDWSEILFLWAEK